MSSGTELNYDELLKLIRQLPKNEIKRLTNTLQSEISADKPTTSLQQLILQAPTWSKIDFNDFQEARVHINKSRIA